MEENENIEKIETNEKLQEFERYIQNKKIAILGIDASINPLLDYLYSHNANVTVFDPDNMDNIGTDIIDKITGYCMGMSFGENYLARLNGFDMIFRSKTIRSDLKEIQEEVEKGAILTSEAEMIIDLCPCTVITVLKNDNNNTSKLIYEIIKKEGLNCYLCSDNTTTTFTEMYKLKKDDILVIELSSSQLMDMQVKPDICVIPGIASEKPEIHISYEEYIESVKNLFKYQNSDSILVLNYDNDNIREFERDANGKVILFSIKQKLDNGYIYNDEIIKFCENGLRRHILDVRDIEKNDDYIKENICACLGATASIVDISNATKAVLEYYNN